MDLRDVRKLRSGDEVFWNDPDDGRASGYRTIAEIEIIGRSVVSIVDVDGGHLECFPWELS